jgi:hypothetical protein
MRATRIAVAAVSIALGCGRAWNAPVEACAQILKTRIPAARVASIAIDAPDGASLDYEIGRFWEDPRRGSIACEFETQPDGGLRLRAAALDDQILTEAEVTVINADLLLAAMQRAGRSE